MSSFSPRTVFVCLVIALSLLYVSYIENKVGTVNLLQLQMQQKLHHYHQQKGDMYPAITTSLSQSCLTTGCFICSLNNPSPVQRFKNPKVISFLNISNLATSIVLGASDIHPISSDSATENSKAFTQIYDDLVWGSVGGGSGGGSDTEFAKVTGYLLHFILLKYGLKSILDAPCGGVSGSWTHIAIMSIKKTIPCFRYHGTDVVQSVININLETFNKYRSWVDFSVQDLSSNRTSLPSGYDLILSRDALQHLSYSSIAGSLSFFLSLLNTQSVTSFILLYSHSFHSKLAELWLSTVVAMPLTLLLAPT